MDTAQWPQGIGVVKPMESSSRPGGGALERKARPQKDQNLNCPRCNSTNTKFCYYNNYSLSQPRYFCKTCRRYWTEGGSLRNVPVGGGSRKNKRSTSCSSSSSSSSPSKKVSDLGPPSFPQSASQNPKIHHGQDLNLAYPSSEDYNVNTMSKFHDQNPTPTSAMELLKTRGFSSFMPMPVSDSGAIYSSGFAMPEFKPTLNFSLDGLDAGYGSLQGVQETGARILFPVEELKPVPTSTTTAGGQGDSHGFWNGMLGGGSW